MSEEARIAGQYIFCNHLVLPTFHLRYMPMLYVFMLLYFCCFRAILPHAIKVYFSAANLLQTFQLRKSDCKNVLTSIHGV